MRLVTTGAIPQRVQIWNSAVLVPNASLDTCAGSSTTTFSAPRGLDVQTPPCLVQNEQVQARAGISTGSGSQVREKEMLPQWHLPWINIHVIPDAREGNSPGSNHWAPVHRRDRGARADEVQPTLSRPTGGRGAR